MTHLPFPRRLLGVLVALPLLAAGCTNPGDQPPAASGDEPAGDAGAGAPEDTWLSDYPELYQRYKEILLDPSVVPDTSTVTTQGMVRSGDDSYTMTDLNADGIPDMVLQLGLREPSGVVSWNKVELLVANADGTDALQYPSDFVTGRASAGHTYAEIAIPQVGGRYISAVSGVEESKVVSRWHLITADGIHSPIERSQRETPTDEFALLSGECFADWIPVSDLTQLRYGPSGKCLKTFEDLQADRLERYYTSMLVDGAALTEGKQGEMSIDIPDSGRCEGVLRPMSFAREEFSGTVRTISPSELHALAPGFDPSTSSTSVTVLELDTPSNIFARYESGAQPCGMQVQKQFDNVQFLDVSQLASARELVGRHARLETLAFYLTVYGDHGQQPVVPTMSTGRLIAD